ncbi:MAG TPA: hypothetical protein H9842_06945 [Candidatus Agathobaculum merdipullorum]|nr:hypothetical protein [uncultured Agathobaculum sp.]HIY13293.1 hypothetical protein [Candidatus Agathobaculum merdipullorum]
MANKSKPLRGRSELLRPDGTVVPVRDFDGNLVIDPEEWEQVKQQIGNNVSRIVSQMVTQHPERKAAFGIPEGQNSATVDLISLLKEKTPADVETTDRRKQK